MSTQLVARSKLILAVISNIVYGLVKTSRIRVMSCVCYNLTDRKQTDARLQQKSRSNEPKVNKRVFLSLFFQCFYC